MIPTKLESASTFNLNAIFGKTPKGFAELNTRRLPIDPRAWQILSLVDGHRPASELISLAPEAELKIYMTNLHERGLIEPVLSVTNFTPLQEHAIPITPSVSLDIARTRISRAVLETLGASGETFAQRIVRAKDFQELKELLTALAPVVEAFGGRPSLQGFIQRVGKIF
jgi:hypothetical protein